MKINQTQINLFFSKMNPNLVYSLNKKHHPILMYLIKSKVYKNQYCHLIRIIMN